jgi:hypothetical protein
MSCITGEAIPAFRFASLKAQLRLEKAGMKSSGGALRPRLAAEFKLKKTAPYEDYIKFCQDRLDEYHAAHPL